MGAKCIDCGQEEPQVAFYESWPTCCAECRRARQKKYYAANRDRYISQVVEYRGEHRIRTQAANAVGNAVREGRLVPTACQRCGKEKTEAHHASYSPEHWLSVVWLCRSCHRLTHKMVA